ncbi:MAG: hypothetical protein IIV81_02795, partial [Clostridia bacterium]|nr:hypothetical protein [Clostridia bacterium]
FSKNIEEDVKNPQNKILLLIDENATESDMAGAYHIEVTENFVKIIGKTERGTAQGVYHIEDVMKLRGEARLPAENVEHAPLFSPRMTHPGFELDTFSDEFLSAAAHAGMDAILVYIAHPDMNLHGFTDPDGYFPSHTRGYCDFNNLVWRAKGYGLDVYIYSKMKCDMHPDDEGAEEYYESSFGEVFKKCPEIKGIIFVGETFEFPSKDERTAGVGYVKKPKDDPRPATGYFPCYDYPDLVNMVKKVIRKYSPDVDIVFWSYNFGWTPSDARLSLIEKLPKDISYQITFEMWEYLNDDLGGTYKIADYSISFPGPGKVFTEEAAKAKECGLRLYSMSNTGGRTWDMGSVPYMPVPKQWQKRYEKLREANELYGLSGLMENHHYGLMPSFLNLFEKNAFTTNSLSDDLCLEAIAKRDWGEAYPSVLQAWQYFSDGVSKAIACVVDQYGAFRCGPTYPLLFTQERETLKPVPAEPWALHCGFGIWNPTYHDEVLPNVDWSLMRLRHVCDSVSDYEKGVALLKKAILDFNLQDSVECMEQLAVADYVLCCYTTAKNLMHWNIAKKLLLAMKDENSAEDIERLIKAVGIEAYTKDALRSFMHDVAKRETENVAHALACQEVDSRLGFEASSEYFFDNKTAAWKNTLTEESLTLLDEYVKNI